MEIREKTSYRVRKNCRGQLQISSVFNAILMVVMVAVTMMIVITIMTEMGDILNDSYDGASNVTGTIEAIEYSTQIISILPLIIVLAFVGITLAIVFNIFSGPSSCDYDDDEEEYEDGEYDDEDDDEEEYDDDEIEEESHQVEEEREHQVEKPVEEERVVTKQW